MNLCVPYFAKGFIPANFLPLVDRNVYPETDFPAGQWDYQLFYQENFDRARTLFEANVRNTVKALFRRGVRRVRASRRAPPRCARLAAGSVAPERHRTCRWIRMY